MKGYYALDGSALIELCLDTSAGEVLRDALKTGEAIAYTHELAITEALYTLCRRVGWQKAKRSVDSFLLSGYLIVETTSALTERASMLKCERPVAISDCFTLALAISKDISALFADRESELVREMERRPLGVDVEFISDW